MFWTPRPRSPRVHARRIASARRHRAPAAGGSDRRRCRSRGGARGRRARPADLPVCDDRAAELLDALPRHETAHGALLADIVDAAARRTGADASIASAWSQPEELSPSELRVLRYLPTNLTRPEIARELYVSINTVNTHIRNIYSKLGARDRSSAVQQARELRLLLRAAATSAAELADVALPTDVARAAGGRRAHNHRIPASPAHWVGRQDHRVATSPGLYTIRIKGRLGAYRAVRLPLDGV